MDAIWSSRSLSTLVPAQAGIQKAAATLQDPAFAGASEPEIVLKPTQEPASGSSRIALCFMPATSGAR